MTPPPTAGPSLLYIDDDEGLCVLVKRRLERRGFTVSTAPSGEAGVALARGKPFDVVAVDHYMPGQDGLQTLAQLREISGIAPIIYVTGSDESRIAVSALKDGAADYVVKSTSDDFLDLLTSAIRQAVDQVSLRRERDEANHALRQANASLEAIVAHQSVLLREVNHRVANSLQLVSSLVHMQLAAMKDAGAREALRDTQARIEAIMQIHRRLYTSEDVEFVDMAEYLKGLVAELQQSVLFDGGRRTIRLDADPIRLETDKAVSLGVVVTELVTNACKYAYAPNADGEVRVAFAKDGADRVRLVVEDDGAGFIQGQGPKGTGLGQTVIAAMARSLNSRVDIDPDHKGARAVLAFQA